MSIPACRYIGSSSSCWLCDHPPGCTPCLERFVEYLRRKGWKMPKQSPIPDDLDRPFYDAANQDRLVIQYCTVDDRWQYPPEPVCAGPCGSADNLQWRENDGAGTIYSYA